jgi:hypothetical protein
MAKLDEITEHEAQYWYVLGMQAECENVAKEFQTAAGGAFGTHRDEQAKWLREWATTFTARAKAHEGTIDNMDYARK